MYIAQCPIEHNMQLLWKRHGLGGRFVKYLMLFTFEFLEKYTSVCTSRRCSYGRVFRWISLFLQCKNLSYNFQWQIPIHVVFLSFDDPLPLYGWASRDLHRREMTRSFNKPSPSCGTAYAFMHSDVSLFCMAHWNCQGRFTYELCPRHYRILPVL